MGDRSYILDHEASKILRVGKSLPAGAVIIKADPAFMRVKAGVDLDNEDPIPFVISSTDSDRINDVVEQDGLDTEAFLTNPVVLFCHNSWGLPLGTSTDPVVKGDETEAAVDFSETRDLDEFFSMTEQMIRRKVLRACSIGFQPIESTWDDEAKGVHFYKSELFEWSICAIGMNRAALAKAKGFDIGVDPFVAWLDKGLQEKSQTLFIERPEAEAMVKAFGRQRTYSLPAEKSMSNQTQTTTKASSEQADEHVSDLKDVLAMCKDVASTLENTAKAFGKHDKTFGKHAEAFGGHADSLKESCEAIEEAAKAFGKASGDDDGDEDSKALQGSIRRALKAFPEALKALEPMLKGGAPHKLSKANLKDIESIHKACKAIKGRHKTADEDERDDEDPKDTGDADKPDEKALAELAGQVTKMEQENAALREQVKKLQPAAAA